MVWSNVPLRVELYDQRARKAAAKIEELIKNRKSAANIEELIKKRKSAQPQVADAGSPGVPLQPSTGARVQQADMVEPPPDRGLISVPN